MVVHVLLDRAATVYAVVTDVATAEEWLGLASDHGAVEVEVDDYETFNTVVEALEDAEEG